MGARADDNIDQKFFHACSGGDELFLEKILSETPCKFGPQLPTAYVVYLNKAHI